MEACLNDCITWSFHKIRILKEYLIINITKIQPLTWRSMYRNSANDKFETEGCNLDTNTNMYNSKVWVLK